MKKLKPIFFNFGLPRTGTTFMQHLLNQSNNVAEKITEGSSVHPCVSHEGLFHLASTFARRNVYFVRTVRDHEETFGSMEFAIKEGGFPNFTLDRLYNWAFNETTNWSKQIDLIKKYKGLYNVAFVEFNIDTMTVNELKEKIPCTDDMINFFSEKHKKESVRAGRMSDGKHKLSAEWKKRIKKLPDPFIL